MEPLDPRQAVRTATRAALAAVVAIATAAGSQAVTASAGPTQPAALGPGPVTVVVEMDHSRFDVESLPVAQGTSVTFVVVNRDPINHELIVGPPGVHDRHRNGTERRHRPVPGEVSVPAQERRVTTYTFDTPGTVEFACHLPGHYDYGMRGEVAVQPQT